MDRSSILRASTINELSEHSYIECSLFDGTVRAGEGGDHRL